ncbi:hypothetical protein cyc_08001 [Cyclospora cayetanensis]|uniref:Uncharacterized protein n=1 Tax=Cyclospora cayetanensis TaxID=88456 RepID=A0A1D3CUU3_9EIME|nr:hypothetical protein cyc_08001 [Cyclospora cayetanensis]
MSSAVRSTVRAGALVQFSGFRHSRACATGALGPLVDPRGPLSQGMVRPGLRALGAWGLCGCGRTSVLLQPKATLPLLRGPPVQEGHLQRSSLNDAFSQCAAVQPTRRLRASWRRPLLRPLGAAEASGVLSAWAPSDPHEGPPAPWQRQRKAFKVDVSQLPPWRRWQPKRRPRALLGRFGAKGERVSPPDVGDLLSAATVAFLEKLQPLLQERPGFLGPCNTRECVDLQLETQSQVACHAAGTCADSATKKALLTLQSAFRDSSSLFQGPSGDLSGAATVFSPHWFWILRGVTGEEDNCWAVPRLSAFVAAFARPSLGSFPPQGEATPIAGSPTSVAPSSQLEVALGAAVGFFSEVFPFLADCRGKADPRIVAASLLREIEALIPFLGALEGPAGGPLWASQLLIALGAPCGEPHSEPRPLLPPNLQQHKVQHQQQRLLGLLLSHRDAVQRLVGIALQLTQTDSSIRGGSGSDSSGLNEASLVPLIQLYFQLRLHVPAALEVLLAAAARAEPGVVAQKGPLGGPCLDRLDPPEGLSLSMDALLRILRLLVHYTEPLEGLQGGSLEDSQAVSSLSCGLEPKKSSGELAEALAKAEPTAHEVRLGRLFLSFLDQLGFAMQQQFDAAGEDGVADICRALNRLKSKPFSEVIDIWERPLGAALLAELPFALQHYKYFSLIDIGEFLWEWAPEGAPKGPPIGTSFHPHPLVSSSGSRIGACPLGRPLGQITNAACEDGLRKKSVAPAVIALQERVAGETWKLIGLMKYGYTAKALQLFDQMGVYDRRLFRGLLRHLPKIYHFQWEADFIARTFVAAANAAKTYRLPQRREHKGIQVAPYRLFKKLAAYLQAPSYYRLTPSLSPSRSSTRRPPHYRHSPVGPPTGGAAVPYRRDLLAVEFPIEPLLQRFQKQLQQLPHCSPAAVASLGLILGSGHHRDAKILRALTDALTKRYALLPAAWYEAVDKDWALVVASAEKRMLSVRAPVAAVAAIEASDSVAADTAEAQAGAATAGAAVTARGTDDADAYEEAAAAMQQAEASSAAARVELVASHLQQQQQWRQQQVVWVSCGSLPFSSMPDVLLLLVGLVRLRCSSNRLLHSLSSFLSSSRQEEIEGSHLPTLVVCLANAAWHFSLAPLEATCRSLERLLPEVKEGIGTFLFSLCLHPLPQALSPSVQQHPSLSRFHALVEALPLPSQAVLCCITSSPFFPFTLDLAIPAPRKAYGALAQGAPIGVASHEWIVPDLGVEDLFVADVEGLPSGSPHTGPPQQEGFLPKTQLEGAPIPPLETFHGISVLFLDGVGGLSLLLRLPAYERWRTVGPLGLHVEEKG